MPSATTTLAAAAGAQLGMEESLGRVFCGPLNARWSQMPDLTMFERTLVVVPIVLMFVLGLWPQLVLGVIDATVVKMVQQLNF